jgi:hypothetical protein
MPSHAVPDVFKYDMLTIITLGSDMVTLATLMQFAESVTVSVYVLAIKPLMFGLLEPLLQE